MDMERTMQFIVDNLAEITVKQQQAEVRAARTDRQIQALQKLVKTGMKMLVGLQQEHKKLAEEQILTQRDLRELARAQKRTDEKFQRWLDSRNGPNGHRKKTN
jgi:hypothetical protein